MILSIGDTVIRLESVVLVERLDPKRIRIILENGHSLTLSQETEQDSQSVFKQITEGL